MGNPFDDEEEFDLAAVEARHAEMEAEARLEAEAEQRQRWEEAKKADEAKEATDLLKRCFYDKLSSLFSIRRKSTSKK